jgi:hypothetical protein
MDRGHADEELVKLLDSHSFLTDVAGRQSKKLPKSRHQRVQIGGIGDGTRPQIFIARSLYGPLQVHKLSDRFKF